MLLEALEALEASEPKHQAERTDQRLQHQALYGIELLDWLMRRATPRDKLLTSSTPTFAAHMDITNNTKHTSNHTLI